MALSTARLIGLYAGDGYSNPCYRYHLARAIVERLKPPTGDDLCERVLAQDAPAEALELLLAAYHEWRTHQLRSVA